MSADKNKILGVAARPTARPTAANRGQPRPTAANRGQPRPTAANRGQPRPTAANENEVWLFKFRILVVLPAFVCVSVYVCVFFVICNKHETKKQKKIKNQDTKMY